MLSSSSKIRRTPGLDRSYTMSDSDRLARIIPWSAGVADPIDWFLNCPGSELCDAHFHWRDPEMCIITKAFIFGLLRGIHEKQEELRLLRLKRWRMRLIRCVLWFCSAFCVAAWLALCFAAIFDFSQS